MGRARDRGQALVQTAVTVIVLLLIIGLAIDFGIALSFRREMQNAADAGALAGAHELCFGARWSATGTAAAYAIANGATDPVAVEIRNSGGAQDASGHVVWVRAEQQVDTLLLGLIGINNLPVRATATAACGVSNTACGLWPLTFSEEAWNRNCGRVLYVWNDTKDDGTVDSTKSINCSKVNCDFDNDGINDVVTGAGRGWVDFSDTQDALYPDACVQSGCGAAEMSCLVKNTSRERTVLPACLPGVGGVRQSVVMDARAQAGRQVKLPVFESTGCTAGRSCPNGGAYRISRFGCAVVEPPLQSWEPTCIKKSGVVPCYDTSKSQLLMPDLLDPTKVITADVIRVMVDCNNCTTDCGATAGGPPPPGGGSVLAVSLIE